MSTPPEKKPEEKPHLGPGFHAFNVANLDTLSPEERKAIIERMLDVMKAEENKSDDDKIEPIPPDNPS